MSKSQHADILAFAHRFMAPGAQEHDLKEISQGIADVPPPFLEAITQHGVKIRLLHNEERYEELSPYLARYLETTVPQAERGDMLASLRGVYVPGEKTVYLTDTKPSSIVHELGHAFDHALGSKRYNSRTDHIITTAYAAGETFSSTGSENGREAFAEWFRAYSGAAIPGVDPKNVDLRQYAQEKSPNALGYLDALERAVIIAFKKEPKAFEPDSSFDRKLEVIVRAQIATTLGIPVERVPLKELPAREHISPAAAAPAPANEIPQPLTQGEKMPTATAEAPKAYDPSIDKQVDEFRGSHYFLSNDSPSPIEFEGIRYPTVDHAFTAARTLNETDRRRIAGIESPAEARRTARELEVRPDWEKEQGPIMLALVRQKFQSEREKSRLLSTGNSTLIYGNTRGDQTWGKDVKTGQGENRLGNILMQVRDEHARGITHPQLQEDAPPAQAPQTQAAKPEPEQPRPPDKPTSPETPFVIESKTERKPADRPLSGMTSRVHENGDITYRFNDLRSRALGRDAFRDCGSTIRLEDNAERSIRAAVQYAKESWGGEAVVLRVAPEVRETVLREAIKAGLKVQNPELQRDIERIKAERSKSPFRRSDSHGSISRASEREKTPSR